jgi:ribosome-binding factor A
MTSGRMRRVDEAIRQVIGEVVAGELKDPRVGFVTVTDVKTSADLSHARVYVSVLGGEPEREDTLAGLRSAHGHLQRRIASQLRMKRTPTLDFVYDDTTDRAMRLEHLLAQERADGEDRERQGAGDDGEQQRAGDEGEQQRAGDDGERQGDDDG